MKLIGRLNLSHKNDDYIMMCNGRNTNLTELLDSMILEDVELSIAYAVSKEKIIDVKGQLYKEKIAPKYYLFHVKQFNGVSVDIDSTLWSLAGCKLKIKLKNTTIEGD